MAGHRRRMTVAADGATGEEKGSIEEEPIIFSDDQSFESEVAVLRRRWELASVLNFLTVFKPVIGKDLKAVPFEQIEMGLIQPNSLLAQLHIILLKGIPPASKILNGPESTDAWVTVLCKKLKPWWQWVAEGEFPLNAANGEEMSRYKELSPTNRLLIMKALCELRVEQYDAVDYINDSLKDGTEVSSFCKDEIGCDGKHTSYWFDGNAVTGYRLYKEVKTGLKKLKGKTFTVPSISFQWETLATHLEEFRKVAEELAVSKIPAIVAVGKTIEADAVSVLERSIKNKENALKRKQRLEMFLNSSKNCPRIARSCRSRRPVSYTYDDYDQVIEKAIHQTNYGTTSVKRRREPKHKECGSSDMDMDLKDNSGSEADSMHSDSDNNHSNDSKSDEENDHIGDKNHSNDSKSDEENDHIGDKSHSNDSMHSDSDNNHNNDSKSDEENDHIGDKNQAAPRSKEDIKGFLQKQGSYHHTVATRSPAAKHRLRQRLTRNSALDSTVIPDSDDEN